MLLVGTVAVEAYGGAGLLRSLAVRESYRNRGIATELLSRAIAYAQSKGIAQCFLLTSTAEDYFIEHGFEAVSRDSVPKEIAANGRVSLAVSEHCHLHGKATGDGGHVSSEL